MNVAEDGEKAFIFEEIERVYFYRNCSKATDVTVL